MFLGLSLTTWLWIVTTFIIITPIIGKQIAKDSLETKNSRKFEGYYLIRAIILFPHSMLKGFDHPNDYDYLPINIMSEEKYIRWMMAGGVYGKFLLNFFNLFLSFVIFFVIYPFLLYFVFPIIHIFSTK